MPSQNFFQFPYPMSDGSGAGLNNLDYELTDAILRDPVPNPWLTDYDSGRVGTPTARTDFANFYNGQPGVKLTLGTSDQLPLVPRFSQPIVASTPYTFWFAFKISSATGFTFTVSLIWKLSTGSTSSTSITLPTASTLYQEVSVQAISPANAIGVYPKFVATSSVSSLLVRIAILGLDVSQKEKDLADEIVTDAKVAPTGITTPSKLAPQTDDTHMVTLYNRAGPPVAKGDLFYSPGGNTVGMAGRSGVGAFFRDGNGNQIVQDSTGHQVTSIALLLLTGGLTLPRTPETIDFATDNAHSVYYCENRITGNLMTAVGSDGLVHAFVNVGTDKVVLTPYSGETIGGRDTWVIGPDTCIIVQSDGADWKVLGGRNYDQGDTWPTSGLYDGLKHFRTDLNLWGTYRGGRWVSNIFAMAFHNYRGSPPFASTEEALACGIWSDHPILVERLSVGIYVTAPNNGSHYWTVRLRRLSAGISVDTVGEVNTSGISNDTWTPLETTSFSNNPLNSTDIWAQIYVATTGSPGAMYFTVLVEARLDLT